MAELGIIPDAPGSGGYVELGATPQGGSLWKKHFMTLGPRGSFVHPKTGEKLTLGDDFWQSLKSNFDGKVATDHVQVPVVGADNKHTESPLANIGEVVDLLNENGKLYAVIDARDEAASAKLGKTLLGCSAFLAMNATDPRSGRKCGPALYHLAVTNRGHLVELEPWEKYAPVIAACARDVVLPDGTVWSDAAEPLMLCAPEVETPVVLAEPGGDYQHEPDYRDYGGTAGMDDEYLRDEAARLGLMAMQLSSGRGSKPEYGMIVTDRDRQMALSAEQQITDTDILAAVGELAEQHQVSFSAVTCMAHDAHIRSGLGHDVQSRARVLGEVQVALSRGRLEVDDEQVVSLSQGQRAAGDEILRLTSSDEDNMFGLAAHPVNKKVTTKTRAHSDPDEDATTEDPDAAIARYLKMHAEEWGKEALHAGSHGSTSYPAKSPAQREAEEIRSLAGGRPGGRSVGDMHPRTAPGTSGSVRA